MRTVNPYWKKRLCLLAVLAIIAISVLLCSCSSTRNVSKSETQVEKKSDSTSVSKSSSSAKTTKDSSHEETGSSSKKSQFNFTLYDSSNKRPVINNYIPTGNSAIDLLGQLAAMGLLKDGSITMQDDSTWQRYNRLLLESTERQRKYDSAHAADQEKLLAKGKDTEAKKGIVLGVILNIIVIVLSLILIYLHFIKGKLKIVKQSNGH